MLSLLLVFCGEDSQLPTPPAPDLDLTDFYPEPLPKNEAMLFDFVVPCGEQCQYERECWECEYYFCPPLDAVWQKLMCFDTCMDPPVLVKQEACTELLECNPADTGVEILDCYIEDGIWGIQEKWCEKGKYKVGPCIPCVEEVCDGMDNDCDGGVDEGTYECETECGPGIAACVDGVLDLCDSPIPGEEICNGIDDNCDGFIDEGQLNACGNCGAVPEEVCDGFDNDCDGLTDEHLMQVCSTDCEDGYEICINGNWQACTAQPPLPEQCNGCLLYTSDAADE